MTNPPIQRLQTVIPVFNDWESLGILLRALDAVAAGLPCALSVSAVDDGSTMESVGIAEICAGLRAIERVEIVRLSTNVGHQRAIAVGLCRAAERWSRRARCW